MKILSTLAFVLLSLSVFAQRDVQKMIQTQLIDVENGGVVLIPEGVFKLEGSLSMDEKSDVTIRGAGAGKTVLNFNGQTTGAEGIKVTNSKNITIEGMSIEDTKGDGIKTQLVNGVTFRNLSVGWTRGADKTNGGYGLYPVQCSNVLIEHSQVFGASDAGIYVGQSKNIIVRNCKAFENVAGIEIENSMFADVHDNETYMNTGGILIFDLPDLEVKEGGYIRVFRNNIRDNNHENFAPKGNIVGKVPLGTGLMILATRNVEVFENKIVNNITAGTAIISYYMTENPIKDHAYKPFPSGIYLHDNYYQRPRVKATAKGRMGKMFKYKLRFGKEVPHIIFDGIDDAAMKDRKICIVRNENATFADINADNKFKDRAYDLQPYECQGEEIKPVALNLSRL
jgi:parallel beta-helix repeat protein